MVMTISQINLILTRNCPMVAANELFFSSCSICRLRGHREDTCETITANISAEASSLLAARTRLADLENRIEEGMDNQRSALRIEIDNIKNRLGNLRAQKYDPAPDIVAAVLKILTNRRRSPTYWRRGNRRGRRASRQRGSVRRRIVYYGRGRK